MERPNEIVRPAPGDARIWDEIRRRMIQHADLDEHAIEVEVAGGKVCLSGSVSDTWEKMLAETIATAVPGVRSVVNEIEILPDHLTQKVTVGMVVVNPEYLEVGVVAEVIGDSFIMATGEDRIYVPFYAVRSVSRQRVVLEFDSTAE